MDRIKKDPRFAHVLQDPRFKRIPKNERKVIIDKRFKGMFKDDDFKLKYTMDKRGRPINRTSKEDMKRFYDLPSDECSTSEEEDDDEDEKIKKNKDIKTKKNKTDIKLPVKKSEISVNKSKCEDISDDSDEDDELNSSKSNIDNEKSEDELSSESENESESESETESEEADDARGVGIVESTDSDSSSDESEMKDQFDHAWGELDTDAIETSEITKRLAVCNMDWDRIKANDIYVLCNSFKPTEGVIQSVKIYLSEYGKSRLKEENLSGPKELVDEKLEDDDEDDEQDVEGSKYHMEKLRKYQLNRLRYYYAVIECDSAATANKIYEECTGIEYESSAVRLDLRFIPDSMTFDDEPKSVADCMPEPEKYKPTLFVATALQQAKVHLTWDETDPDRVEAMQKAFEQKDLDKVDLRAYIALSDEEDEKDKSSDDEDDDKTREDSISKYRELLLSIEDKEKKKRDEDVEMEITWTPGLKEATQEIVDKQADETELTPWDQYLKKKRDKKMKKMEMKKSEKNEDEYSDDELPDDVNLNDDFFNQELGPEFEKKSKSKNEKSKKKQKLVTSEISDENKAELELLLMEEDDGKQHFNLKSLMKKGKKKEKDSAIPDTFQINVNDERFSEVYTSHLFNVDPSDTQFKKTKGMESIIEEKQKRRKQTIHQPKNKRFKTENDTESPKPTKDVELSSLVKSIKNRTQTLNKKKKWK